MKRLVITVFVSILCVFVGSAKAQRISKLKISPLEQRVVIQYAIENEQLGQSFRVEAAYSLGGDNYQPIDVQYAIGDIGPGIEGGRNLVISWDVLEQLGRLPQRPISIRLNVVPESIKPLVDNSEKLEITLREIQYTNRKIKVTARVENKGSARNLRLPNRTVRIYTDKGSRHEAFDSKLGDQSGTGRHAAPTLKLDSNATAELYLEFRDIDPELNRIAVLELNLEAIKYTYALDLQHVHFEWRELPANTKSNPKQMLLTSTPQLLEFPAQNRAIDKTGPKIQVLYPTLSKKPFLSQREILPIEGKVSDKNGIYEVTVNGFPVSLNGEGSFAGEATLFEGDNTLFIKAVDKLHNQTELTYTVQYQPAKKSGQRQSGQSNTLSEEVVKKVTEGNYYALLIGVEDYRDEAIQPLDNPVSDATQLGQILISHYQFSQNHVYLLKNPGREDIIDALDQLNQALTPTDNLLVFYAGHGYWDAEDEIGYWLPADATQKNTANWLRNSTLRDYLRAIKTKHTLLISDACFSGSIFKTRKAFADAPKSVEMLYEYPSRKAMTSGTLKEVPDKSVFMLYFLKRLKENTRPYLSAEELFSSFRVAVMNNSPNVPQFGEIQNTGDEGGDFIFLKR